MSSTLCLGTLSAEVCVGRGGGPSSTSPFEKCKYLSCCYPTVTSLSGLPYGFLLLLLF